MFSKKLLGLLLVFMLTFSLTAVGQQMAPGGMAPQEEVVVATIDGEDIFMHEVEMEAGIQQIIMGLQQQPEFANFLFTSPEGQEFIEAFKRDQLNNLIARKLLEKKVDAEEIELTEEDKEEFFQEQLQILQQQYQMDEEQLLDALAQQGIESLDEFKDFMIQQEGNRLRERKLLEEVVIEDLDITDEDARELYEEQQIPMEFEQIKDELKFEVARERFIEQLRDEANIEIYEDEFDGDIGGGGMMMP